MLVILSLIACFGPSAPTNKNIQSQKAEEAASQINFSENAEIDNIKRRLELTSSPGLLGYVVLLNESGQPVRYTTVKGKITSSGKRLTRSQELKCERAVGSTICNIYNAASDEGTFGSSDPYIYFWSSSGQYIQWNGAYLYSDQPIRLSIQPLVIEVE